MREKSGIRCSMNRADVMIPSHPSFCTPGKPPRNLSVTSLPSPCLRNCRPGISSSSGSDNGVLPSVANRLRRKRARSVSWIFPRLWSQRSTSSQFPSGVTIFQEARLSTAVPHRTAFLPPAFMATLPPIHEASAEVGSTANTSPLESATSMTRRVTAPAPQSTVATSESRPGKRTRSTGPSLSSFSVLMTAENRVSGMAPPV